MKAFPGVEKPLVGMIHLPPLPGAANYGGQRVVEIAKEAAAEARLLAAAGFDGVMLQNTHDRPARLRGTAGTIAAMAAVASAVRAEIPIEMGINVHKNDAEAALAIAVSSEASFVRVKVLVGAVIGPEGVIEGAAQSALDTRRNYAPEVELWADLYELTSWAMAPTSVENVADLATRFGLADRLIVTDPTVEASLDAISRVRLSSSRPVLVGGRTNADTVRAALHGSDGVIVGTCLRRSGRTDAPLDEDAIARFMRGAGRLE